MKIWQLLLSKGAVYMGMLYLLFGVMSIIRGGYLESFVCFSIFAGFISLSRYSYNRFYNKVGE